jgi:hypothetical protein
LDLTTPLELEILSEIPELDEVKEVIGGSKGFNY